MAQSVNLGRFSRWVEKYFNFKGLPSALSDVEGAIRIVLPLASGVEDQGLQSWARYGLSPAAGPNAGTTAAVQIRNPAGSNVIAVVQHLCIGINTGTVATFSNFALSQSSANPADLTTPGNGTALDPRVSPTASTCIVSTSVNAGSLANGIGVYNVTGTGLPFRVVSYREEQLFILPGQAYRIVDLTVNETMRVNIWWKERALETSELT